MAMPSITIFWASRNKQDDGQHRHAHRRHDEREIARTEIAAQHVHRDRQRHRVLRLEQDARLEIIVPGLGEGDDAERGERRPQLRQRNAKEDFQIAGAVHQRGFFERLRLRAHELADKKDAEARREIHERKPDWSVQEPDLAEAEIDRDDRDLRRKQEPGDHDEEQSVAPGKVEPGEGERGERAGDELADGDEHRDLDAVGVDLQERHRRIEDRAIVVEVEPRRQEARRHLVGVPHGAERHAEEPRERQQHEEADERHHGDDRPVEPALRRLGLHVSDAPRRATPGTAGS